ncbi:MAG: chemotaxis protein, partial [Deltaproteobacteria bacterium]|nr:chemotaxis protein [Deltaproteobacteria bacterium]
MFKKMKLGTITVVGFAIMMILIAVVAYIGYSGLSGVADSVAKADDMNRIIKLKMESQISNAIRTLVGGFTAAIFIGLVFAFGITRALVSGISNVVGNIKQIAEDTVIGKHNARADVEAVGVDFKAIPEGVNKMLDAMIEPLNVAVEYIDRIGKGDIPDRITDNYKGDVRIKNNLNQCIDAVNGLVAEAVMLTEAATEGRLDTRGDVSKFGGDYAKIVQGVNDTLDAVIGPLNVAAEYIDRI